MLSNKNKGVISVYLCMMFAVMIPVILLFIGRARVVASMQQIEMATSMGMDSALSEYHQVLLDRYGLLLLDTSYGEEKGSVDKLINHIRDYTSYNLDASKGLVIKGRDFLGLKTNEAEILKVSRATDNNGSVFRYMALSYMLQHYGYTYVENTKDLKKTSDEKGLYEYNIVDKLEDASKEVDSIDFDEIEVEGTTWDEVDTSSPVETINSSKFKGILSSVCKQTVSSKEIDLSSYASKRDLVKGDGIYEKWPDYNDALDELLFDEYILLKCGNYVDAKEGSLLDYEVEYVIGGSNNDTVNLREVANKILLLRGASNATHFYSNSSLKSKAKAYAAGLAAVTVSPQLYKVYKAAIELAWIYGESVNDVRIILDGGKVPLVKKKSDWNTSLTEALAASFTGGKGKGSKEGQDYKDYLRLILVVMNSETKTKRMMDVIEMDIRNITKQQSFALDNCIAAFTLQSVYESSYGASFIIKRSTGYQ